MKKIIIISVIAIVVVGYFMFGGYGKPELSYLTIKPKRGDVISTVLATGSLQGRNEVNVGAQVNGQLQHLHVKLGDKVKKGDLIAEIDPRTQENSLASAKADLKVALANLKERKALLKQQQNEYDRQVKMRARNATSDADVETALANLEQSKARIEILEAEIEKSKLNVSNAETNLGYTTITAPRDGVVISIVTEEGQTVVSNQSAPTIVKLADLSTMTVEAEISEADVVKVQTGMPSYFTILGLPDRKFNATLRQVEPAPESASSDSNSSSSSSTAVYYNALLDVPNEDGILRVSMTAEVTIVLGESKNVLTLPISVLGDKVGPNTYVVNVLNKSKEGGLERREVVVGRRDNINYEVISGVTENDEIVLGSDVASAEAAAMAKESQRKGPPRM